MIGEVFEQDFVSETSGGYVEVADHLWNSFHEKRDLVPSHWFTGMQHMFSVGHGRNQVTPRRLHLP